MRLEQLARLPEVLFEIGKAIGSDEDVSLLLARISKLVCELLAAEACSVMLLDSSRACLLAKAAYGVRAERMKLLSFQVGEGVAGWVCEHGEPALIGDVSTDPRFVVLPDSRTAIVSMACVPLLARGARVGVMTATSGKKHAFHSGDVELLSFIAKTIALDVENIRLHRVSVTDPLTGAYNREFLQRRLPHEMDAARTRGEPLAVAMVDVDHFKSINDRFGHEVGDRVLAEVSRRLRRAIRKEDLLVRYGGEEFLVVLPRAGAERAAEIGERMRRKMQAEPIAAVTEAIEVRVSVGVAQHRRPADSSETTTELVSRADQALYSAKRNGRNRVEVAQ